MGLKIFFLTASLSVSAGAMAQPKVQSSKGKFQSLVDEISMQLLLDPHLISAIITQESSWQQFARSPKGALGLMQLMPETAKNWGSKNPFDARENILVGAHHIKYLIALFDGNLPLALAAYHAGEARIIKEGTIPAIKETQDYVKAVQMTYDILAKKDLRVRSR